MFLALVINDILTHMNIKVANTKRNLNVERKTLQESIMACVLSFSLGEVVMKYGMPWRFPALALGKGVGIVAGGSSYH